MLYTAAGDPKSISTLQIALTSIRDKRLAKYSREKFEKDSNSLTFQQFDSRNLIISKVPKMGGRGS